MLLAKVSDHPYFFGSVVGGSDSMIGGVTFHGWCDMNYVFSIIPVQVPANNYLYDFVLAPWTLCDNEPCSKRNAWQFISWKCANRWKRSNLSELWNSTHWKYIVNNFKSLWMGWPKYVGSDQPIRRFFQAGKNLYPFEVLTRDEEMFLGFHWETNFRIFFLAKWWIHVLAAQEKSCTAVHQFLNLWSWLYF